MSSEKLKRSVAYYDAIATGYEELHMEEQLKKISIIKKKFHPKKTDKLLDVGSGTGVTTEPWECERYGIDPAPKLLARARNKENIVYKEATAENIPFDDNFFDVIVSITAIQNFYDVDKALSEMKRVVKPGSEVIITTLKRNSRFEEIFSKVSANFLIKNTIEEDKDIIWFCSN